MEVREAASRRVLDWYLYTASSARGFIRPRPGADLVVDPADSSVEPLPIAEVTQAVDWLEAERQVLVHAVQHAAETGFDDHAWKLAWTLNPFFDLRRHIDDWIATARTGQLAADRLGSAWRSFLPEAISVSRTSTRIGSKKAP